MPRPRASEWGPGFRTMITRSFADPGTFKRSGFDVLVGWIWHLGFIIVLFLFIPHIELIKSVFGVAWPGLPNPIIDAISAVTLVGLVAALVHRLMHPVKQHLSTFEDYLTWGVTFLVVITGYVAYHRLVNPYPDRPGPAHPVGGDLPDRAALYQADPHVHRLHCPVV
jgi:hypothetical protein